MTTRPDPAPTGFRKRLLDGERLVGTFIKTPATHPVEIAGGCGFDFVVLDEEHAPWDRTSIDHALLAARAAGTAGIVRVSEPSAAKVLGVLDDGGAGVMVPHVSSPEAARAMAAACRYRGGRRGFSNSTRAGGYGAQGIWDHVAAADAAAAFIAMIEDAEALENLDAIIATEGLDAVFIGRVDLSVAIGAPGPDAPEILKLCEDILAAARKARKPAAVMVAGSEDARRFADMGASVFLAGSDQAFMRQAGARARADIAGALAD